MYDHKQVEKKWKNHWLKQKRFQTKDTGNPKFYVLDMFPYPSGAGLHVGHPQGYTATDIVARYKRLKGFDVLHPIGWDAFGLPAEQFALKTGNHPATFTEKNINVFRQQLQNLGFSFDYDKEVNTTDPAYFKITQWIFIQIYKAGLAEIRNVNVNWCPKLGTCLANEEIITQEDGTQVSEVGNFPVVQKPMKQWVLKITKYADYLFNDLKDLAWPSSLKKLQQNWIKNKDGTLHLKDWIFSRQRYWGEPFPIAFSESGEIFIVDDLPVQLPLMEKITPSGTGESPLANAQDWLYFKNAKGEKLKRETNTMPQWAGSCWYYIAYILKQNDGTYLDIQSKEAQTLMKKWLPVDLYVGGQEHAVLHLLYARFWHKVLYDLKIVPTKEPFYKIVNQGMILGPDGQKMSKSRGNIISTTDIVSNFGADTLRVYEMFMGPLEDTKNWSMQGVKGIKKWLGRVYQGYKEVIIISEKSLLDQEFQVFLKEVTNQIEELKFNTTISQMMVFINAVYKKKHLNQKQARDFLVILSLFAPHLAEELLNFMNEKEVYYQKYPVFLNVKEITKEIVIPVQVNGKLRGTISPLLEENTAKLLERAQNIPNVKRFLQKPILKKIYVPLKIINFVTK